MRKFYVVVFSFVFSAGFAQHYNPMDRDWTYNQNVFPENQYFIGDDVMKTKIMADGKILVLETRKLVKMNGNLIDTSFNLEGKFSYSYSNESGALTDFCVQPDGKILVAGSFNVYNGLSYRNLIRLNADGSQDIDFKPPLAQMSSEIHQVSLQPDGKIIIFGETSLNGDFFNNIFRLNPDGTIDTTFTPPVGYHFKAPTLLPNGKFIVNHNTLNEFYSAADRIACLNANGTFDTSFITISLSAITPREPYIDNFRVQADGKILVYGQFTGISSMQASNLSRINADGTLDTAFTTAVSFDALNQYDYERVYDVLEQPDHKLIVGGHFTKVNNVSKINLVRLNVNGTIDQTFGDGSSFLNITNVRTISLFPDQKVLVAGALDSAGKNKDNFIAKLNADGSKDPSFNNVCEGFFRERINTIVELPDGKLLVGGGFHHYNGKESYALARLNSDGAADETLNFGGSAGFKNLTSNITKIAVRPDGKFYVAGTLSYNNGSTVNLMRLNADGSADTSFAKIVVNGSITTLAVKPDGGIYAGGTFYRYDTNSYFTDGFLSISNAGFVGVSEIDGMSTVRALAYQSTGKLVIGNGFYLKRILANHSIDASFVRDPAITSVSVTDIKILAGDKILLNGAFTINGSSYSLVRLMNNGAIDPTFDLSLQNAQFKVARMVIAPDDKILVYYTDENDRERSARLHVNGTLDTTFPITLSPDWPTQMLPVNGGKILLYGQITNYEGKPAMGITRLMGENYYFITGENTLDANNSGCDTNDPKFTNMKYRVSGGASAESFDYVANVTGSYRIGMTPGNYTVTPILENPTYFSAIPASISLNFPEQVSPQSQSFCITPSGNHPDLEVTVWPLTPARPGFTAKYKMLFKNKGNQLQSGTVRLNFDDSLMNVTTALPAATTTVPNTLGWNFSNLKPYESREIEFTMQLNMPTATPPVTGETVLTFNALIDSPSADETPLDNNFNFNQQVVNSFDPNDKTCLEGHTISTAKVGDYVHYMIRFENKGTYAAQNISVKDVIDTEKFDINSLIPMKGSHVFTTRISDSKNVEFYFENINLPFADATNDGYIAFKIKTRSQLVQGDTFSNSAAIYFDYNPAIITNTATTTVGSVLANSDLKNQKYFVIAPNPVASTLTISKAAPAEMYAISIYNELGQLIMVLPDAKNQKAIDVSGLRSGNYFVKIASDKGNIDLRFVKI